MKRPSKKDIKAAVAKLKENTSTGQAEVEINTGKPTPKHTTQRIRKQGV